MLHDPPMSIDLGQNQMSGNLLNDLKERRREDDDWEYTCAKTVFWSTATDKEVSQILSPGRNSVAKLFVLKNYPYQKNIVSFNCACQARKGSSEMPRSLRQSLEAHSPVSAQFALFWCLRLSAWTHEASRAEYPHSLLCSLSLLFSKWIWTSVMQMPSMKIWHRPLLFSWHQKHRADLHECRGWLAEVVSTSSECLGKRTCFIFSKKLFLRNKIFCILAWILGRSVMKKSNTSLAIIKRQIIF